MAGCIDCKFYESELGEFDGENFGSPIRDCTNGNVNDMHQWWKDNGTVKREDVSDMSCHESTDIVKMLDGMIDGTNEMLEILKTK